MDFVRPPRLVPGDAIAVIAPSGPVFREAFAAGAAALGTRYRVRYDDATLFAATGFLAGSDEQRLAALHAAVADPETRAVLMARGGHGLLRIGHRIDRALLRAHPKPIVAFSDGVVLLARAAQAGIVAIHGPMVNQLGRVPAEDRDALFALLESPEPRLLAAGLEPLRPGKVSGRLLGGNLEMLSRLLGTALLPDLDGAVLVLEEIGERPYRIDRLLCHLELAGVFARVAAVVVGDLLACEEPPRSPLHVPTAAEVVRERLSPLPIPVALGLPVGHGPRNRALPYGARVELDNAAGTLIALEGAVS